jgi:riboflavin synthase alpha subunit
MEIACPAEIMSGIVPKGSVAIDGVSLTVVDVSKDRFSVALIPHTLQHTTLGVREVGDRVNLEVDVLGKYVLRYLEQAASGRGPGPRTDDS